MLMRIIPWIFITVTVAVLVGLGGWQVQRLAWKEQLLAEYEAGRKLPTVNLLEVPTDALKDYRYRRVYFSGKFLHDKEVHLGGRRWHGKTGYHLTTPMQLEDGRIFLINRGWIPFELKDIADRPQTVETEGAVLQGVIRHPKQPNIMTPENHPKKNFWFTVDFPAVEEFTGLELEPVVIEAIAEQPDINQFPIMSNGERVFRNDHLGYAITWFSLALAAIIIFWLRIVRRS